MRYFIAVAMLSAALASCVQVDPAIRRLAGSSGSAYVTVIQRYAGVAVVSEVSYLAGVPKDVRFKEIYKATHLGVTVRIKAVTGSAAISQEFLGRYAGKIAEVPDALLEATGVRPNIREISIALIPTWNRFEATSRSFAMPSTKIGFALRVLPAHDDMLGDNIRIVAHELFHVAVGLSDGIASGPANERGAVTAENCVALILLGRTTDALPLGAARGAATEHREYVPMTAAVEASVLARYGSDHALQQLFERDPIILKDSAAAGQLMSLCRQRTRQLMSKTP